MTQLSSEKPELFKGRHFNHLLIIQAVRWYVTYKLSYRDGCDLMAERGVTVVHTTVLRWVQRFVPASEKKRRSVIMRPWRRSHSTAAVSYTHLTLPTILRV